MLWQRQSHGGAGVSSGNDSHKGLVPVLAMTVTWDWCRFWQWQSCGGWQIVTQIMAKMVTLGGGGGGGRREFWQWYLCGIGVHSGNDSQVQVGVSYGKVGHTDLHTLCRWGCSQSWVDTDTGSCLAGWCMSRTDSCLGSDTRQCLHNRYSCTDQRTTWWEACQALWDWLIHKYNHHCQCLHNQ